MHARFTERSLVLGERILILVHQQRFHMFPKLKSQLLVILGTPTLGHVLQEEDTEPVELQLCVLTR
jgi:hypothetical protein